MVSTSASLPRCVTNPLGAEKPPKWRRWGTQSVVSSQQDTTLARHNGWMRVSVRVKPGASRPKVGGQYGDGSDGQGPVLIVSVAPRAVDGAATEAALLAVAKAFDLRRADVGLVSGMTSRTKVLELVGGDQDLSTRLAQLLSS